MPFELADEYDERYEVPATIWPEQLSIGAEPRSRLVRGYGADVWFAVLDGLREPAPLVLSGVLFTDHDDVAIENLIEDFRSAVASAHRLVHTDASGADVSYVDLLGALEVTTSPHGVDGTMLRVTAPLLPAEGGWRDAASDELEVV